MSNKSFNEEIRPLKTVLARALYDNEAEVPSELTFSRGDLITVLDKSPQGYEGWCICNIRGKIGIAPRNRLEFLGSVNQRRNPNDTDIYDDPAEFYIPETRVSNTQQDSNSTVYSNESLYPSYENIDGFVKQVRLSGLTDSGHYSNRSSDVSLGPSSGAQQPMETQMTNSEITNCAEHIYENPNRKLIHTLPKQHKNQPHYSTIMSTLTQDSHSPSLKSPGITNQQTEGQIKKSQFPTYPLFENVKSKSKFISSGVSSDGDDSSLQSDSFSYSSCSFFMRDLPTHFHTKMDFIKFWEPIFKRLRNNSQLLMQFLSADSKADPNSSPILTHCEFDQDLLLINQLCTFMIALSKSNPDAGLTRKFVLHRQTLENLGEKFEKYWKAYHEMLLNSNEFKVSMEDKEKLFKMLQSELDILETTILANFSLLFPTSLGKQQTDRNPQPQSNMSDLALKLSTIEAKTTSDNFKTNSDRTISKSSPTNEKTISELIDNVQKFESNADYTNPSDSNLSRTHFYRLLSLCDLASDDVQAYLLILLSSPHNDQTGKLLSSIAAATTAASAASDVSSPSSSTPTRNNHKNTSSSSQFVLTSNFMIAQTKHILNNCSRLVQFITELCTVLINHEKDHANRKDDYIKQFSNLRYDLENCGDKICESLKGLITQTKESTRHINASQITKLESGNMMIIPAPLLQRLVGAVRSVGFALDKIKTTLNKFLETCKL